MFLFVPVHLGFGTSVRCHCAILPKHTGYSAFIVLQHKHAHHKAKYELNQTLHHDLGLLHDRCLHHDLYSDHDLDLDLDLYTDHEQLPGCRSELSSQPCAFVTSVQEPGSKEPQKLGCSWLALASSQDALRLSSGNSKKD